MCGSAGLCARTVCTMNPIPVLRWPVAVQGLFLLRANRRNVTEGSSVILTKRTRFQSEKCLVHGRLHACLVHVFRLHFGVLSLDPINGAISELYGVFEDGQPSDIWADFFKEWLKKKASRSSK